MNLFDPKSKDSIVTIPNIITLVGILLVFAYMIAFWAGWNRWIILAFLFLAEISDADGTVARYLRQETIIGEMTDPFRDRLLLLAILLNVIFVKGFEIMIIGIIFFETAIALTKILSSVRNVPLEVRWLGKLRQIVHIVCGFIIVLKFYFYDLVSRWMPFVNRLSFNELLGAMIIASALTMTVYMLSQIREDIIE